jgi:hypothetical protein
MITNSEVTIYHNAGLDVATHDTKWVRYNYNEAWFFGGKGAGINKGYTDANNVEVRIPYEQNANVSISNFKIGDIIVKGELKTNITKQQDLKGYDIYNITSITNNDFGNNQHIHLGGK